MSDHTQKKNASILAHIEQVVQDIELAQDIEDKDERRAKLKGVLFYWLGIVFDDAQMDAKDLKTALDASMEIIERLKSDNETLKARARKHLSKAEEI